MVTIYKNYPHGMKDKEIEEAIKEYTGEMYKAQGNLNTVLHFSPLIQLGQIELQGRQTKRVTALSIIVSFVSLIVAGSALSVSLYSSKFSSRWEQNQLVILRELKAETINLAASFKKTLTENTDKNLEATKKSVNKIVSSIEKLEGETANKPLKATPKFGAP